VVEIEASTQSENLQVTLSQCHSSTPPGGVLQSHVTYTFKSPSLAIYTYIVLFLITHPVLQSCHHIPRLWLQPNFDKVWITTIKLKAQQIWLKPGSFCSHWSVLSNGIYHFIIQSHLAFITPSLHMLWSFFHLFLINQGNNHLMDFTASIIWFNPIWFSFITASLQNHNIMLWSFFHLFLIN
jgi:hypothetical protein